MTFEVPTLDESHAFLIALFKALRPEDDISEGSFNWLFHRTSAAAATGNDAHIAAVENDLLPDTALGDMLTRWAKIRGVTRKSATPARKAEALRVFGVATTAVPDDSELVHSSGLRFKIVGDYMIGSGGYEDVDVVAIDTGSATRLNAGETLTFVSPIANVEEGAELQLDLDEDGEDAEADGALQLRVLSRFSNPPLGGAAEDYVQWALEEEGYAAAYAYPIRNGLGTVDLAALHAGSGTVRAPSAPEVAVLQALIDVKRPVSVKAFRVLEIETEAVDIEVTILPDGAPEHAFDWDDSTPPTVVAWDNSTRVLELDARPPSLLAGHRIVVAEGATARERVVEVLGPGADEVTLELDATGDEPDVGNTIYAGGPLVQPVRDAIQALLDSLGTANPDGHRYGTWEGNLRPTAIGRVTTAVTGVLDGTVVAPASTEEASDPAYPDNDVIGLLIAGRILVRCEH